MRVRIRDFKQKTKLVESPVYPCRKGVRFSPPPPKENYPKISDSFSFYGYAGVFNFSTTNENYPDAEKNRRPDSFYFDLSAYIGLDSEDKKRTARASAAFYCVVLPYIRRVHKKSADIRKGFKIITYRTIMNSAQALQRRTPCRAALRFVFFRCLKLPFIYSIHAAYQTVFKSIF